MRGSCRRTCSGMSAQTWVRVGGGCPPRVNATPEGPVRARRRNTVADAEAVIVALPPCARATLQLTLSVKPPRGTAREGDALREDGREWRCAAGPYSVGDKTARGSACNGREAQRIGPPLNAGPFGPGPGGTTRPSVSCYPTRPPGCHATERACQRMKRRSRRCGTRTWVREARQEELRLRVDLAIRKERW